MGLHWLMRPAWRRIRTYITDAERLRALRPLYEQRERQLMTPAGLRKEGPKLTLAQRAIAKVGEHILKGAGISLTELAKQWASGV
jgi:hypothetical protein